MARGARLGRDAYAVRKDLSDLVRLLLATGMRLGEALTLGWDDETNHSKSVPAHTMRDAQEAPGARRTVATILDEMG